MTNKKKGLGVPVAEPTVGLSVPSPQPITASGLSTTIPNAEDILDMDRIIEHMVASDVNRWCTEVCGTTVDGVQKWCVRGHLMEYGEINGMYPGFEDMFHECWATEYMYYPVNDGRDKDYQQATPKERVIAYFKDLRDGKRKSTYQLFCDEYAKDISIMAGVCESDCSGNPRPEGEIGTESAVPS